MWITKKYQHEAVFSNWISFLSRGKFLSPFNIEIVSFRVKSEAAGFQAQTQKACDRRRSIFEQRKLLSKSKDVASQFFSEINRI